jgi:hypothetical protein
LSDESTPDFRTAGVLSDDELDGDVSKDDIENVGMT